MEMESLFAEEIDDPTVGIDDEVYVEDWFVKEVKLVLLFEDQMNRFRSSSIRYCCSRNFSLFPCHSSVVWSTCARYRSPEPGRCAATNSGINAASYSGRSALREIQELCTSKWEEWVI
jgi:hypothetical protein